MTMYKKILSFYHSQGFSSEFISLYIVKLRGNNRKKKYFSLFQFYLKKKNPFFPFI